LLILISEQKYNNPGVFNAMITWKTGFGVVIVLLAISLG